MRCRPGSSLELEIGPNQFHSDEGTVPGGVGLALELGRYLPRFYTLEACEELGVLREPEHEHGADRRSGK
jgi:hypothetical protein